jgi:hypothetical protein
MAVFCTSAGCIGIWRYPFLKSILLKTLHPATLTANSIIFGKGYASGTVTVFSLLKSPHGRQDPSGFCTIVAGTTMDYWTAGRSRLAPAVKTQPLQRRVCRRNLLAMACRLSPLNSSKNAASHSGDSGGCSGPAAVMGGFGAVSAAQVAGPALSAAAGGETVAKDCEEAVSTRHAAAGFTDNLKCLKKSTTIMGNFTFAKRKIHEKRRLWNDSSSSRSPQQPICWQLGPVR